MIRLANAALDEVRRRVQHTTTGHRGRKTDPLYRIRRRLLAAHDRLDPTGFARMLAWLDAGDPDGEVGAAYLATVLVLQLALQPLTNGSGLAVAASTLAPPLSGAPQFKQGPCGFS